MRETDVLVIGGSAAGVTTAITAHRHYPTESLMLVRREKQALIPCGIPYVFGTVGSCDRNLIPDQILADNGVRLLIDEVTAIDREEHTVSTAGGEVIRWRKLVLATGSVPTSLPIPGADLPGVYTVQKDVDYLDNLLQAVKAAQNVVVIGGGFIGLEMADECRKRGMNVTVIEVLPHCLELVYDDDLCERVERELVNHGITVRTNGRVTAIEGNGKAESVLLNGKERLPADLVILSAGVRPNIDLARAADLRLSDGTIWVDRYMRSSDRDIFAVGDCAFRMHYLTGAPTQVRLASVASAEARVAGANLFDLRREFNGAIGVYSTKIGDLAMGLAGLGERAAKGAGVDYVSGVAEASDKHPSTMPEARPMRVKLVFKRYSGALIGGQVCCGETAGEFVNIVAAMIQGGMTADQIATFQMGTHPVLTASPISYQLSNAAEIALMQMRRV